MQQLRGRPSRRTNLGLAACRLLESRDERACARGADAPMSVSTEVSRLQIWLRRTRSQAEFAVLVPKEARLVRDDERDLSLLPSALFASEQPERFVQLAVLEGRRRKSNDNAVVGRRRGGKVGLRRG